MKRYHTQTFHQRQSVEGVTHLEQITELDQSWNLEQLYRDLTHIKQQQGFPRRKLLTSTEKACLRGLLSGYTPTEIASSLHRDPNGLRVELSRGLYRYIEALADQPLKNWSKVPLVLAQAGYRAYPIPVNPLEKDVLLISYPVKSSA